MKSVCRRVGGEKISRSGRLSSLPSREKMEERGCSMRAEEGTRPSGTCARSAS